MRRLLPLLALGCLSAAATQAQRISPYLAGQNAWMAYSYGSRVYNGQLDQLWPTVKKSKVRMVRVGGNGVEFNMPTPQQYLGMIDSIRRIGAEPMVQVSEGRGRYTAQQAAAVVDYVNNQMGRGVKYWIIGNEPNLTGNFGKVSVDGVETYIKSWATAMKQADPTILTVGPETSFYDTSYLRPLLGGANDVTGQDAHGRYYLDVITFHSYPFSGTQTRASVLNAANTLAGNVNGLLTMIDAANVLHNRTGAAALKWAVTEFNIDYQNPVANGVDGLGVHGFLNGQYWAEVFGVGMQKGAVSMMPWSIHESNGARTETDLGYLDGSGPNVKPRSAFYHEMLVAENMYGTYLAATDNQADVSVLSSQHGDTTALMVLNKSNTTDFDFTVQLSGATVPGAAPLKINVPAGLSASYSDKIYGQSTLVLLFDGQGQLTRKIVYSLQHAANTLPPTYLNPGQQVTLADFKADKTFTCVAPEQVTFAPSILGSYASLSWNFGADATPQTATGAGPFAVSYATPGQKSVTMTLQNADTTIVVSKADYVQASACVRTPYSGTAAAVPGIIKAVEFDNGGQNVAYYDSDPTNRGAALNPNAARANEAVDTEAGGEGLGNIGYSASGEWLKYTVNVQRTGLYKLTLRAAATATGGSFRVSVDGVDKTGVVAVPATGAFGTYQDVVVSNVYLEANAAATLKFDLATSSFNFAKLTFEEQAPAGIVVNRIYNATSTPDGMSDAVELLVTKDHQDLRGLVVKDFESSLTSDAGGKYQLRDVALWKDVRIGTTIVLRRLASGISGYAEDADATDYRLDLLLENAAYLTNLAPGSSFNLTNTDMVLLKTGAAAGTAGAVHGFATGSSNTALFNAVTAPKLVSAAITNTGQFQYPLSATQSVADYNGTAAAASYDVNRNWGNGYGASNIAYIQTLRNAAFTPPAIVVNRVYNGSNDANGQTDAVELLVTQDHFDARNLVVKDFETNNTVDNGGKYRFNNLAFWQDLRLGTTIVLRRVMGPAGYVQDLDATDFTLDLLLDNTGYLTNLATSNSFNITQYDMVLLKTGTAAGVSGAIHAFATKGGGSNGVPSALFNSVAAPKLTSPDGTDAGGGTFHYPLSPEQQLTDYAGAKGALSKSPAINWGYGFGAANVAYIDALRDSVFARPTATWQGDVTACAGPSATLPLRLTGSAPWTLGVTDGRTSSTVQVTEAEVDAAGLYQLPVPADSTRRYRLSSLADAHYRTAPLPTGSATLTVQYAPTLTAPTVAAVTVPYGQTSASIDFAATAAGSPTPTLTYRILKDGMPTIISAPYQFPVGTTTVTATASNNCGSATSTFEVTVNGTPASLSVLHQDADGQPGNNVIRPNLQLRNESAAAIPYEELTMRYWLTAEDYAPVQAVTDWAQLGTSSVRLRYVPLAQPVQGAFGYVEYGFPAAAGSLAPGALSGPIQSRLYKQNWTNLSEADDYSYAANTSYQPNAHLTVYRNGVLVGGVEPAPVAVVSAWKVLAQNNAAATTNSIGQQWQLRNEGNQPASYADVMLRYWFTPDGSAPMNYCVDYAQPGNPNVQLRTGQAGAETYAEMRFAAGLGTLSPLSGTGSIQFRLAKADWSNFSQLNDHSYQPGGPLENARITVYVQGQLVYGQEPAGAQTAARGTAAGQSAVSASPAGSVFEAFPNPFSGRATLHFRPTASAATQLRVYNALGQLVTTLFDAPAEAGRAYTVTLDGSTLKAGVYTCRLLNGGRVETRRVVLVK